MEYSDEQIQRGIRNGDLAVFEELYKKYYIYLCLISEHITHDHCDAEEIVSDVFVKLWSIRTRIQPIISIKSYLVKAVYNTSLNYLGKNKIRKSFVSISDSDYRLLCWDSDYPLGQLYEKETKEVLERAINNLPDGCREIFMLSRDKCLKYHEIAEKLGISVNTVKAQIKIALSRLREAMNKLAM